MELLGVTSIYKSMRDWNCFSEWQRSLLISLLSFAISVTTLSANAAVITWTNAAGGNWSNPLNWSPNQVPGQSNDSNNTDDVIITGNNSFGFFTVTFDEGDATNFWGVHDITIGGDYGFETLSIANGATLRAAQVNVLGASGFYGELSCTASSGVSAPVTVSGGQLVGGNRALFYGPVIVGSSSSSVSGVTFCSSLIISNNATVTFASSTVLGAATIAGKINILSGSLTVGGPLTNSGTITFLDTISYGGSAIYILNDGSTNFQGGIVNLPGGVFKLNNAFNHGIQGLYGHEYFVNHGIITSTNGGVINIPTFDNSTGTVTNWSGILSLGQFTNAFAGNFYSSSGSFIWLKGGTATSPLTPGSTLSLNGPGGYQFMSGFLLLTNNLIPNLSLTAGNLELGPNFQDGAITNLAFDSMWLTNNTLPITGTMTVNGSTAQVFGGLTVLSGGILNANCGTYHGNFLIASNGTMTINPASEGSPLATIASDASLTVNGTLNVLSGGSWIYGPLINFNMVNIATPFRFFNNGINHFAGLVNRSSGVVNMLTNGSLITGGEGYDYLINSGSIVRTGDTNNDTISLSFVTNSGAITAQRGTLQFNKISLLPSSSMNVRLNSKTDYGKISIGSTVTLAGSFGVTLATNYWPNAGDSFQALTYSSYAGNFTITNLPPTIPVQLVYNLTNVMLRVTSSTPVFTAFAASNGQIIFSGTNGLPQNTYQILASTNLSLPLTNWSAIATNQFDNYGSFIFTNPIAPTNPQQFFIIKTE